MKKTIILNYAIGDTIHSGEYNPISGPGISLIPKILEKVPEAPIGETHKAVLLINRETDSIQPPSLSLTMLVKVVCYNSTVVEHGDTPGLYLVNYSHYPRAGEKYRSPCITVNKLCQKNVFCDGVNPTTSGNDIHLS